MKEVVNFEGLSTERCNYNCSLNTLTRYFFHLDLPPRWEGLTEIYAIYPRKNSSWRKCLKQFVLILLVAEAGSFQQF